TCMMYLAVLSFDYNLIIAIPMIALWMHQEWGRLRVAALTGFAFFCTGFAMPRGTYSILKYFDISPNIYLWFQVSGLTIMGVVSIAGVLRATSCHTRPESNF
ncbi:MAG: hypothetical protein HQL11_06145, partial [Candidatus Omnitrophica bacterium]|nr:hypothetical protein [Candidatus Omnitrophota bacterium]